MIEYHKIQTVFKRDPANNHKTLLMNNYSLPEFEYLKGNEWIFTEKVDGTNVRVCFNGERLTFGGKTDNSLMPATLLDALNKIFLPKKDSFKSMFTDIDTVDSAQNVILFGEGYGAKIQKGGGNYRQDQSFVLFDINVCGWWLQRKDVEDIAKSLCIDIVPIIGKGDLDTMVDLVSLKKLYSHWGNFLVEGIVARPETELKTRSGHRIITKIKHKDFRCLRKQNLIAPVVQNGKGQ